MARVNPLMILPPLIFAGLAGLFIFGMAREDSEQLPSSQIGRDAPSIAAVTPLAICRFRAMNCSMRRV